MNIDESEHLTRKIPSHITVRRATPIVSVQSKSTQGDSSGYQERVTQNRASPIKSLGDTTDSQNLVQKSKHLKLVEQNSEFKRYQFVMKQKEEVKINWVGGSSGKKKSSDDLLNVESSKPKTIRRSAQKVKVTRNGVEEEKIVYNRD